MDNSKKRLCFALTCKISLEILSLLTNFLKKIFQNLEYNNQGMPKKAAEESERIRQKLRERNKKAKGGMIDKSLPGRSRYI